MQVTISIPDEFAAKAQARGQTPENYIEQWVAEQAASLQSSDKPEAEQSLEEFNAALDAMTRYSEKIPSLPIDLFSRASFYEDHD